MGNAGNALMELIGKRRSCRKYRQDAVPDEVIREIVEAGRLAPSGNNMQTTHFIVVKSAEKLGELRRAVTAVLKNTPIKDGMPPPLVGLIKNAQQGEVDVNYGSPVLILTANKKGYNNAMADCACALENMMLSATANGLGSCWINQYALLGGAPALADCLASIGLAEDEQVYGALAVGYSDHLETTPLPRKGNPVTYV